MQLIEFENLSLRIEPGYAVIALKANPVNALSESFIGNFMGALSLLDAEPAVAVLIVRSELKVFSAGGDATWMAKQIAERGTDGLLAEFERLMLEFRRLCIKLRTAKYVTVAEIKGHALAGGLELAAACDIRVIADDDDIRLGVPEMAHFGVPPSGGGGVYYLTRLLGAANAMHLVLHGQAITPKAALAIGLAQELLPPDQIESANEQRFAAISAKAGSSAMEQIKKMLYQSEPPSDITAQVEADRTLHWQVMRNGNFRVNAAQFAERFGSRK